MFYKLHSGQTVHVHLYKQFKLLLPLAVLHTVVLRLYCILSSTRRQPFRPPLGLLHCILSSIRTIALHTFLHSETTFPWMHIRRWPSSVLLWVWIFQAEGNHDERLICCIMFPLVQANSSQNIFLNIAEHTLILSVRSHCTTKHYISQCVRA